MPCTPDPPTSRFPSLAKAACVIHACQERLGDVGGQGLLAESMGRSAIACRVSAFPSSPYILVHLGLNAPSPAISEVCRNGVCAG